MKVYHVSYDWQAYIELKDNSFPDRVFLGLLD